ncbi:AfsR/SARP family transcriptional regulator [Streptomyces amakusaensis]
MWFNLMGPFEIITDSGETLAPKAPKVSQMLAVLALQPRETVPMSTLIRELWGENPPSGAMRTLQTHVYHARRMLADARVTRTDRRLLTTMAPGYRLDVADDEVDVRVFERLVRQAQGELERGTPESAADLLERALTLWRGPVLSNVPIADVLAGRMAYLEELRLHALELRVETEMRLGRHREFLPELRVLVHEHPLHEWFHGQLISALHQSGRRGEALQAYQNLYCILKRELGLEPSPELRRLQSQILNSTTGKHPRRLRRRDAVQPDHAFTPFWFAADVG